MNIILIITSIINLLIKANTISFPYCFEYGCEECSDDKYGSCTKCKNNFKLIDGKCPCADSNCFICESSLLKAKCHYCNKDSLLYEEECICNMRGCENCRNNKCLKCNMPLRYSKEYNQCKVDFSFMNCYDKNCEFCSNNEKGSCIKCNLGYELINGTCSKLEECVKNYFGICEKCENNNSYINNDGYCSYKCLKNKCDNRLSNGYFRCENKCLFCDGEKLYALTNCENSDYCNIDNCLYCLSKTECLSCNPGYYKQNGICNKCPDHCIDCYSSTYCNTCEYEYKLNNQNQCKKIIDSDYEYMNEVINFEIDYLQKKVRKLESEGYNLIIDDLFLSKNENIQHCLYEANDYCYLCESEYKLSNGMCFSKNCEDENCENCVDNNCYYCKKGYENVYDSNTNSIVCQLKEECEVPNCKNCENKTCIDCEDGYHLSYYYFNQSNICEIDYDKQCGIENCILCENYQCQECKSGYQLNFNRCFLDCNIDNCFVCNEDHTCEQCKNGYYGLYCEYTDNSYYGDNYDNYDYLLYENNNKNENCPSNCDACIKNLDICLECKKGCKLNNEDLCECNNSKKIVLAVVLVIVFVILTISGVIIYKKRDWIIQKFNNNHNNNNNNNNNHNNNNNYNNNYNNRYNNSNNNNNNEINNNYNNNSNNYNNIDNNINTISNSDVQLSDTSIIMTKTKNDLCVICSKKEAKYLSNCGCQFCSKDSFLNNGFRKKCPKCKKKIDKLTPIEFECGICLQSQKKLKHFICNCAFLVCEECFNEYLSNQNKNECPNCRKKVK